jgi:hypothetical protein
MSDLKTIDEICEQLRPIADFAKDQDALHTARNMLDARQGWQPIDTAPRDGTDVLLWWPYYKLDDKGDLTDEECGGAHVIGRRVGDNEWDDPQSQIEGVGQYYGDDH